jgi:hypothetical protein
MSKPTTAARVCLLSLAAFLPVACGSNDDVTFDPPATESGGVGGDAGTQAASGKGGASGAGRGGSDVGEGGASESGDSGAGGTEAGGTMGAGAGGGGASGSGDSGASGANTGGGGSAGASAGGQAGVGGAAGGDGGSAGDGGAGDGGSAGGESCAPGAIAACYGGPAGTEGVGTGQGGVATCGPNGSFGPCQGAVLPANDGCDGVDRDCDGSWIARVPTVCPTIQKALDVIVAKDLTAQVLVAPGTYTGDLDFHGARAQVVSEGGRGVTTLVGTGKGPVVTFRSGETNDSSLVGFRVQGGTGLVVEPAQKNARGGGIYVKGGAPTLRDLDVTKNRAEGQYGYGGGIYLENTDATLSGIRVFENVSSYYGGGISISGGAPDLRGLTLVQNTAVWGGAVAVYFSSATLRQSLLAKNKGQIAGSVFLQGEDPRLENVTIVGDEAPQGGLVRFGSNTSAVVRNVTITGADAKGVAIENDLSPLAQVSFTNVWGAGAVPLKGFVPTPTVSKLDPGFVSTTGAPLDWDVHLKSDSPLRDAGDPAVKDADGSRSDIGAFGGPD